MLRKNIVRKFVTLTTLTAVWTVFSMVALAVPAATTAQITVTGQVTVNGQMAVSNATVMSGAVIAAGANSNAVISLGKIGRVEVLADSNLTLNFTDTGIVAILSEGKARVSNSAGVSTTLTTKHATFIGDSGQANNFMVEVECSHSHIDTTAGVVTMREGSADKQVVAGTTAVAGNLVQTGCKPCLRPGSTPGPAVSNLPWLLLLAAAGAGIGIWLGTRNGNDGTSGTAIVVSPTR